MRNRDRAVYCKLTSLVLAGGLALSTGCATLAHRSSMTGQPLRTTSNCTGDAETCPWLLGDAGLLVFGVIPGVVAMAIDVASGAWRHANLNDTEPDGKRVVHTSMR